MTNKFAVLKDEQQLFFSLICVSLVLEILRGTLYSEL